MSWTDKATTAEKITAIEADMAALESSIAGNNDVQSYQIGGKNLSRYSLEEKTKLHTWLSNKLTGFQNELSIAAGDGRSNKIVPRF